MLMCAILNTVIEVGWECGRLECTSPLQFRQVVESCFCHFVNFFRLFFLSNEANNTYLKGTEKVKCGKTLVFCLADGRHSVVIITPVYLFSPSCLWPFSPVLFPGCASALVPYFYFYIHDSSQKLDVSVFTSS